MQPIEVVPYLPSQRHPVALRWRLIYGAGFVFCLLIVGFSLFVFAYVYLSPLPAPPALALYYFILPAHLCLIPLTVMQLQTHMVTSAAGLEYHGAFGFVWACAWEDIERIGLIGPLARWGLGPECLVLRRAPNINYPWLCWFFPIYRQQALALFEFGAWRYLALGQEIRRYAPHLFQ